MGPTWEYTRAALRAAMPTSTGGSPGGHRGVTGGSPGGHQGVTGGSPEGAWSKDVRNRARTIWITGGSPGGHQR
eukprot:1127277-Prorocentrum_minimum.AAC.1